MSLSIILISFVLVILGTLGVYYYSLKGRNVPYDWTRETLLITGGSQGIGRNVVELCLSRHCHKIIILDVIEPKFTLDKNVKFIKCDITNEAAIKSIKKELDAQGIFPSILVNNAGIWNKGKRITKVSEEEFKRVIDVNLLAPFRLIRTFLPAMLKSKHGRIVNISSILGVGAVARMTDYCASKFGLYGMNESLRMELKADGFNDVKTCIICPFHVDTQMFKENFVWSHQWLLSTLSPEYVAQEIVSAIERGREEVWLPRITFLIPIFRLFPISIYNYAHFMIGTHNSIIDEERRM